MEGKWGNPFPMSDGYTRAESIAKYELYVTINLATGIWTEEDLLELDGMTLGCFCAPKACHGDVLVKVINRIKMFRKLGARYTDSIKRG